MGINQPPLWDSLQNPRFPAQCPPSPPFPLASSTDWFPTSYAEVKGKAWGANGGIRDGPLGTWVQVTLQDHNLSTH